MKIIACLGNPGKKYSRNRHNIGFMAGVYLAEKYSIDVSRTRNNALYGTGRIDGRDVMIVFPQTYMNLSGEAVIALMKSSGAHFSDLLVIHDELELPFGDLKTKEGGGHKGHNGLRSIIQVGGSADFTRLRFGIGRPESQMSVADYVLSDFTSSEMSQMQSLMEKLEALVLSVISK